MVKVTCKVLSLQDMRVEAGLDLHNSLERLHGIYLIVPKCFQRTIFLQTRPSVLNCHVSFEHVKSKYFFNIINQFILMVTLF